MPEGDRHGTQLGSGPGRENLVEPALRRPRTVTRGLGSTGNWRRLNRRAHQYTPYARGPLETSLPYMQGKGAPHARGPRTAPPRPDRQPGTTPATRGTLTPQAGLVFHPFGGRACCIVGSGAPELLGGPHGSGAGGSVPNRGRRTRSAAFWEPVSSRAAARSSATPEGTH
jgi:hypothetical protein